MLVSDGIPPSKVEFDSIFVQFQKEQWLVNVNQFVEDEDEESFSCSVRISAQYLLMVRRTAYSHLIVVLPLA